LGVRYTRSACARFFSLFGDPVSDAGVEVVAFDFDLDLDFDLDFVFSLGLVLEGVDDFDAFLA